MNTSATEMPKAYDPKKTEQPLYDWWEAQGYFKPQIDQARRPFVISMPPPNVTGELHLGHAITAAIEDLMIRYHRMRGDPTLWVPGSDHAGIATQNVVEKELAKEGLTRHDLGREKFVERVWEWKHKYGTIITKQHRRLGVSCDWERERFTLDEELSRAVREAFVQLYKKGLIYRGTYLINWCPRCETAISDLEVIHWEEPGKLYYVRYPIVPKDYSLELGQWGSGKWLPLPSPPASRGRERGAAGYLTVATTRPETILADTAVAVHPDDKRYANFIGAEVIVPSAGRRVPVIADQAVDLEFGTGALKITPGHDPTDYEIGQRHKLPIVSIIAANGTMNAEAKPYQGLDRLEARQRMVADLEKEGLLVKTEDYSHALGHCQRCDTIIEPLISTQWFVKIKPLAEPAIAAVRDGRIRIVPEHFAKVYFNWMENIRDWCISRQLWWGHRIPVWYCDDCGGQTCETIDPIECAHCGSKNIHQDEDVLDTWFSSGLWPFSTLGWPDDTPDLRYFYPTSVLETAYDILFFWVARMIMMGLECTNNIPFDTVYLHGLIRDELGRKMSKSLNNVINPLDLIEQYGTDALRFTLLTGSTPGNDMRLSTEKLEDSRNFANKLWNAARFVIGNAATSSELTSARSLPERWILSRLNRLIADVTRLLDEYQFGEAGRLLYEFLWGEYCDWYIEMAKIRLKEDSRDPLPILVHVLDRTLRLLHPFMPFVTEEVWQNLKRQTNDRPAALIVAPWPQADPSAIDEEAERDMALVMEIVRAIRNARAENRVEPGRLIEAIIVANGKRDLLASQVNILATLARIDPAKLHIGAATTRKPDRAITLVAGGVEAYLPLAGMINLAAERQRLEGELAALAKEIARSEDKLGKGNFVAKAPPQVVERERTRLGEYRDKEAKLRERLESLAG